MFGAKASLLPVGQDAQEKLRSLNRESDLEMKIYNNTNWMKKRGRYSTLLRKKPLPQARGRLMGCKQRHRVIPLRLLADGLQNRHALLMDIRSSSHFLRITWTPACDQSAPLIQPLGSMSFISKQSVILRFCERSACRLQSLFLETIDPALFS